jgi:hypothetical protein
MSVIPVNAFKAEDIALEVQKGLIPQAAPAKPKGKKFKTPAKKEDGEEGEEAAADDGEGGDAEAEGGDAEDDAGEAEDSGTEEVAKDDATDQTQTGDSSEAITALQKSLDGITVAIAGMSTQITEATGAVKEELSERLDTLEAKVKKTDEALAGTVHSEDADEDETAVAAKKAQGSEEVNWDNVLDFGDVEFS